MKALTLSSVAGSASRWSDLRSIVAHWRSRQSLRELLTAEEWLLKDIGLTRSDVAWAMSLPLTIDPANELNRIAQRSRSRYSGNGKT